MKKLNKYIIAALLFGMMGTTACEKDFLDVNTDPNNAPSSTPQLTLPAGLGSLAYVLGNQYQILGNFWAQHWTQSGGANQYQQINQYQVTSTNYDDRVWGQLYAGALTDFKFVSENGTSTGNVNHAAIAEIMSAYTFQVLTDAHDRIPFSEALQGAANLTPKYDSQEEVYNGLIPMIDNALAKIDAGAPTPGAEDFVFGGDMALWRRFANTLKLKIYLRQAYVRPAVAEAGIRALYNSNAQFLENGMDAEVTFSDVSLNRNPIFQTAFTFRGGVDIVASNTVLDYMLAADTTGAGLVDPRIDNFFAPAESGANAGQFVGVDQGAAGTSVPNATNVSKPGMDVAGPTAAVPFISAAESYFLQAEAAARYGVGSASAATLYARGVTASFNYFGDGSEVAAYLASPLRAYPTGGSVEEQVERIITEKWLSMNGRQGFEAWTEHRRTDYPSFIEPALNNSTGNVLPKRLPYVNSERTSNPNTPPLEEVTVPVWWDVN